MSTSKEKMAALKRAWNARNREKVAAQQAQRNARFRKLNPNYDHAKWRRLNPEKSRALSEAWAKKNRVLLRNRARIRRAANRDAINAKRREYRKHHKEGIWRSKEKRRVAMTGVVYDPAGIAKFRANVRSSRRVKCYYCRKSISGKSAHIDHIAPIRPRDDSPQGQHAIGNLCAACPHCNLTKHTKKIGQWQPEVPQQVLAF